MALHVKLLTMTPTAEYLIITILGLIVGSFLNVCIYRMPRDMNIIRPRSSCPSCGGLVRFYDNIPILSFLLLKGRCRDCGSPISIRYPIVEALNGIMYLFAYMRFGLDYSLPIVLALLSSMVVITFIDLEFQIIPDQITLPGILIGLVASSFVFPDPFEPAQITGMINAVVGLFVGGGLFLAIAVLSKGGMGGGDIKMMAMVGAFMGWKGVLLTTLIGSVVGSAIGIGLMVFKGKDRKTKIPFGPFLAFGAVVTLFGGALILDWYLGGPLL
jgi:leader peptidase (prepilin peptidase)/N-methyltransferase